ncbi:V-set and immunoglobulin domain-containing protein 1 [Notolabrus celidotus]|uniref:V-set and immunoglobulin domain-containing protein 1 n=1 Tax=Notolabrus celidotus TaxID=1203425 RepID=UPI00149033D1|nr:V-set and immunoglobulin domain-containing protein 1 [Notolabrus celidotus]
MQLGWRELFLILTALSCCSGLQVTIEKEEYEVAKDGDITFTCSFVPARPFNALVLTWGGFPDEAGDPMKSVATFFPNHPVDIAPAYEGRAFMEVDIDRRVSTLRLTKVTMQDSRQFQCSVKIPNDDEGITAAITFLLVLVRPSPPICRIQGTAEYGHNISLTCLSEEGSPQPSYKWKSHSVENIPRQFPPKTTEKDGTLSLFNVSREMSGFYICSSTNRVGSASCNLTLSVVPASMKIGSTAVIIGGVLAGVVLLGIVIFCFCRKKGKKDELAEGSPEEMAHFDKDAPGAEQYLDDKSNTKQYKDEDKDVVPKSNRSVGAAGQKPEDDQHSSYSGKGRNDGKGGDVDSQRYQDDRHDQNQGSRDRLDEKRNQYSGSRDRLDDQRDHYRGSRDRLDEPRDQYRGSRDRLDEPHDQYRGSRDRLDEPRDHYRGSRDRLDEPRDQYRGSRDRLDEPRDQYRGSRERLDEPRDHYRGSRDRLDDGRGGSRDHIAYIDDRERNGYD